MDKMPNFANLDVQGALNTLIAQYGADEYVKNVRYLPKDETPRPGTWVLTLENPEGAKVQVEFEPASPLMGVVGSIGLAVL